MARIMSGEVGSRCWCKRRPPNPFFSKSQRHRLPGEEVCSAYLIIHAVGIARQALLDGDFASQASEAPRPETPCQVESGTVASRNATRPCQENSRRSSRGVARPWQPRHLRRCHACSRALPQTGRFCCAPHRRWGRNNVLKRSWFASPVFESVQNRFGSSSVTEDRSEGLHYRAKNGERRVMLQLRAT